MLNSLAPAPACSLIFLRILRAASCPSSPPPLSPSSFPLCALPSFLLASPSLTLLLSPRCRRPLVLALPFPLPMCPGRSRRANALAKCPKCNPLTSKIPLSATTCVAYALTWLVNAFLASSPAHLSSMTHLSTSSCQSVARSSHLPS